jgi:hypothetical protein
MKGCEACARAFEEESELASLLSDLPRPEPSPTQHAEARHALLDAASRPAARRSWLRYAVAGLVAAALLGASSFFLLQGQSPLAQQAAPHEGPRRGTIYSGDSAHFAHLGNPGDEVVTLRDGTITVEVEHLKPGERFRVLTGDAEVEVRGTIFEVTAANGKLVSVKVIRGAVEVRPSQRPPVLLAPGEGWKGPERALPSEAASLPASEPASVPATVPATAPALVVAPVPAPPSPTEIAYDEAFSALRTADHERAATLFYEVSQKAGSPFAEDASFWHAVALSRAKRNSEARGALSSFVEKYPHSSRANEAHLLLGKILLANNELDTAQQHFETAAKGAPAAIAKRAQEGLDAIEALRNPAP